MGFFAHDSIIVTGQSDEYNGYPVEQAHKVAMEIFGNIVSNITGSYSNAYASFFIAPDGSKEGFADSKRAEKERNRFLTYLKTTTLQWCYVYFDENGLSKAFSYNEDE